MHHEEIEIFRVTAADSPTFKSTKMEVVSMWTGPAVQLEEEGDLMGRNLGGDLNNDR